MRGAWEEEGSEHLGPAGGIRDFWLVPLMGEGTRTESDGENLVFDVLSWRFCLILEQLPRWWQRLPDVRA